MSEYIVFFYPLLFIVAFLYASVGHGGASGYLALMALFSFAPEIMRPTALTLNVFVSLMAFWQYYRKGNFNWQLFFMLAVASVPAAFLGGWFSIDASVYKKILGVVLIVPIIRFMGILPQEQTTLKKAKWLYALLLGASIGFLSGLIGIGGGIILTPVLLLLSWTTMKEAAGISAFFITVNSVAGLLGKATSGLTFSQDMVWLVGVALIGGTLGAYLGANRFSSVVLKRLLALVLLIASVKLLFT